MQSPVAVAKLKRLAHERAEDGDHLLQYGLLAALLALAAVGVWSAIANRF